MERRSVSTGTVWEEENGYSRAVRAGSMVFVSGTLASDSDGNIRHPDAPHMQTLFALDKAMKAAEELGATKADVVRTRLYVAGPNAADREVGRAHGEFFAGVRPCCTLLGVARLASPTAMVEVEIDAVVAGDS